MREKIQGEYVALATKFFTVVPKILGSLELAYHPSVA
jgi:hypothetical protein